jgi:hypothetical protein
MYEKKRSHSDGLRVRAAEHGLKFFHCTFSSETTKIAYIAAAAAVVVGELLFITFIHTAREREKTFYFFLLSFLLSCCSLIAHFPSQQRQKVMEKLFSLLSLCMKISVSL